MARHTKESDTIYELDALNMLSHCFKCPICKKYCNRNKKKQVMGMFSWKLIPVCTNCFSVLGLEVTSRVGA